MSPALPFPFPKPTFLPDYASLQCRLLLVVALYFLLPKNFEVQDFATGVSTSNVLVIVVVVLPFSPLVGVPFSKSRSIFLADGGGDAMRTPVRRVWRLTLDTSGRPVRRREARRRD